MLSALKYANEGLQELETTFSHHVAALSLWLPPQHIDSLWIIFTTWNGLHAGTAKHPADLKVEGSKPWKTTTYAEVTRRISNALTGLRQCSSPEALAFSEDHHGRQRSSHPGFSATNYANSGAAGLGWHVLRSTMRKLEISIEAIEELAVLVRVRRERLPALRHEVCAAVQMLKGLQDVTCAGKGKGKAAMGHGYDRNQEEGEEEGEEEYDWPDCGSI